MKKIYLMFLGLGFTTMAANPPVLNCKVTELVPAGANFFLAGGYVEVGDETTFDFGAKEVSNLQFKSGNALNFSSVGAKVTLKYSEVGYAHYTGARKGLSASYRGSLVTSFDDKSGLIQLQVLRENNDLFALHEATLVCQP